MLVQEVKIQVTFSQQLFFFFKKKTYLGPIFFF
jgi:hypothetical protein